MGHIQFGIDLTQSKEEIEQILNSLTFIEMTTSAHLIWDEPKNDWAYCQYLFDHYRNKECALSMMNDVHIDYPFTTSLKVI